MSEKSSMWQRKRNNLAKIPYWCCESPWGIMGKGNLSFWFIFIWLIFILHRFLFYIITPTPTIRKFCLTLIAWKKKKAIWHWTCGVAQPICARIFSLKTCALVSFWLSIPSKSDWNPFGTRIAGSVILLHVICMHIVFYIVDVKNMVQSVTEKQAHASSFRGSRHACQMQTIMYLHLYRTELTESEIRSQQLSHLFWRQQY